MPDPNNPTDTTATPVQVNPPSEPSQTPISLVSDLPPSALMDIPPTDASIPPPFPPDSGSAAPSFDIPPVITPGQPKKKFGGKRVIATILGLLVLVGGLGAGVILVKQQQDIREKAAYPCGYSSCSECRLDASYQTCINLGCCPAPTTIPTPTPVISCALSKRDPLSQGYCDRSAPNTADCTDVNEGEGCTIRAQCGGGTGSCVVIDQGGANAECQCQKGGGPTQTPTPTGGSPAPTPTPTSPPSPGPTAQCLNVKAYDTSWNLLTTNQLKALKAGNKVRFTVGGTTTGGSFDKARFRINGVQRLEVTGKRPGTEEYFDEYTIPEGITTFSINAQIHHTILGWSN